MITLGKRKYRVAYEEGQEQDLERAVNIFDEEMSKIGLGADAVRENQHLMLGGLMLAYRQNEIVDEIEALKVQNRDLENEMVRVRALSKSSLQQDQEQVALVQSLKDENRKLSDEISQFRSDETSSADAKELKSELEKLRSELDRMKARESVFNEKLRERDSKIQEAEMAARQDAPSQTSRQDEQQVAKTDELTNALKQIVEDFEALADKTNL